MAIREGDERSKLIRFYLKTAVKTVISSELQNEIARPITQHDLRLNESGI